MKRKRVAKSDKWDYATEQIVKMCFDSMTIDKFSLGLKMIYALDDPPLFVRVEEVENEQSGYQP